MNARKGSLLLVGWCLAALGFGHADPAVLMKTYSAKIVRGGYVLGSRMVKVGEVVTVQAIKGVNAEVTTEQNDRLTVLVADLRTLPEPTPLPPQVAAVKPPPTPVPMVEATPAPGASPALIPLATPALSLGDLRASLEIPLASGDIKPAAGGDIKPAADRRETKVRCSHLTKKGKQCTRMTSSPNGFCWQHGGD